MQKSEVGSCAVFGSGGLGLRQKYPAILRLIGQLHLMLGRADLGGTSAWKCRTADSAGTNHVSAWHPPITNSVGTNHASAWQPPVAFWRRGGSNVDGKKATVCGNLARVSTMEGVSCRTSSNLTRHPRVVRALIELGH